MHPKFNPAGVRTHDLQIMAVHFDVTETTALTTWPSVTSPGMLSCTAICGLMLDYATIVEERRHSTSPRRTYFFHLHIWNPESV